jgi:hypothetical protein
MARPAKPSPAFAHAREAVIREWGERGFHALGQRLQRALLGEAILAVATAQDESVPAEAVRRVIVQAYADMVDATPDAYA